MANPSQQSGQFPPDSTSSGLYTPTSQYQPPGPWLQQPTQHNSYCPSSHQHFPSHLQAPNRQPQQPHHFRQFDHNKSQPHNPATSRTFQSLPSSPPFVHQAPPQHQHWHPYSQQQQHQPQHCHQSTGHNPMSLRQHSSQLDQHVNQQQHSHSYPYHISHLHHSQMRSDDHQQIANRLQPLGPSAGTPSFDYSASSMSVLMTPFQPEPKYCKSDHPQFTNIRDSAQTATVTTNARSLEPDSTFTRITTIQSRKAQSASPPLTVSTPKSTRPLSYSTSIGYSFPDTILEFDASTTTTPLLTPLDSCFASAMVFSNPLINSNATLWSSPVKMQGIKGVDTTETVLFDYQSIDDYLVAIDGFDVPPSQHQPQQQPHRPDQPSSTQHWDTLEIQKICSQEIKKEEQIERGRDDNVAVAVDDDIQTWHPLSFLSLNPSVAHSGMMTSPSDTFVPGYHFFSKALVPSPLLQAISPTAILQSLPSPQAPPNLAISNDSVQFLQELLAISEPLKPSLSSTSLQSTTLQSPPTTLPLIDSPGRQEFTFPETLATATTTLTTAGTQPCIEVQQEWKLSQHLSLALDSLSNKVKENEQNKGKSMTQESSTTAGVKLDNAENCKEEKLIEAVKKPTKKRPSRAKSRVKQQQLPSDCPPQQKPASRSTSTLSTFLQIKDGSSSSNNSITTTIHDNSSSCLEASHGHNDQNHHHHQGLNQDSVYHTTPSSKPPESTSLTFTSPLASALSRSSTLANPLIDSSLTSKFTNPLSLAVSDQRKSLQTAPNRSSTLSNFTTANSTNSTSINYNNDSNNDNNDIQATTSLVISTPSPIHSTPSPMILPTVSNSTTSLSSSSFYPCVHCDHSFSSSSLLTSHLVKHSTEKPFECSFPDCPRSFKRNHDMLRHQREKHLLIEDLDNEAARLSIFGQEGSGLDQSSSEQGNRRIGRRRNVGGGRRARSNISKRREEGEGDQRRQRRNDNTRKGNKATGIHDSGLRKNETAESFTLRNQLLQTVQHSPLPQQRPQVSSQSLESPSSSSSLSLPSSSSPSPLFPSMSQMMPNNEKREAGLGNDKTETVRYREQEQDSDMDHKDVNVALTTPHVRFEPVDHSFDLHLESSHAPHSPPHQPQHRDSHPSSTSPTVQNLIPGHSTGNSKRPRNRTSSSSSRARRTKTTSITPSATTSTLTTSNKNPVYDSVSTLATNDVLGSDVAALLQRVEVIPATLDD